MVDWGLYWHTETIHNLTMDYEVISSMLLNPKFFPEGFVLDDDFRA